ncbi:MAG: hypothetical protein ACRDF7_10440 [Candidatus Limnocylindrales bacterium]
MSRRVVGIALASVLVGAVAGIAVADVASDPGPFTGCLSNFDGTISQVAKGDVPFGGSCTNGDDTQIIFSNDQTAGLSVYHEWHIAHTGGGGATSAGLADSSIAEIPAGTTITYDVSRTAASFTGNFGTCRIFELEIAVSDQPNVPHVGTGLLILNNQGGGPRVATTLTANHPLVTIRNATGPAQWHVWCQGPGSTFRAIPDFNIDVYFHTETTTPFE